jgi:hypothetical protein
MPDAPIPFPLTSAPGKNPHESAGRLINCYAEPLIGGARAKNVWRKAPGLKSFKLGTWTGWRGGIVVGNLLYAGFTGSNKIASYANDGTETSLGTRSGTKKIIWARNNKATTPDVIGVDPDNGAFQVTTSPSVIDYPDSDVGSPNSVCFLDGYFFFTYGDGTCIASAINDTAINPLDFVKVDGNSNGLLRAIPFGELYLFGNNTIEPWQNTAEATGFPFSRVKSIPVGLLGRYAITGYEPGFGKGLIFVASDKTVQALNGYEPTKISTPDVDRAISSFIDGGGSTDDIELFPYVVGGHACAVMRTPDWTWTLDIDNVRWHERQSSLLSNARFYGSVNAFGKWLAGDSQTANIVEISESALDELGDPLPFTAESGPVTAFPNRLVCNQVTFDVARGVGIATGADPTQTDPSVFIQWSDDGGINWSTPIERKLARQATSPGPVRVNRCGLTKDQGRRWRVTMYDAVDIEMTGGSMSAQARA